MKVGRQFRFFLRIYIRLKGPRFLWLLVVGICLISNNFLYIPVDQLLGIYGMDYVDVKEAVNFVQSNRVLLQRDLFPSEVFTMGAVLQELGTRDADPIDVFSSCHGQADCNGRHFDLLFRGSDKFVSLVEFGENRSSIVCNMAAGGELYCPFLGYLVGVGQLKRPDIEIRFKTIRLFRSIGRFEPKGRHVNTQSHTLCDMETKYPSIFPGLVTTHAMLAVLSQFFYHLVSTMACIYSIKGNGFLQLLVLKGFSARAYWIVLWLVCSLEVLMFATVFTVSYAAQCPGFYLTRDLVLVFWHCLAQFYCIAAVCLLVTVLVATFGQAALWLGILSLATMLLNLLHRLLLSENHTAKMATLILPPGHLGEYIQAALLAESTQTPLTDYHQLAFISAVAITVVLVLAALYLDVVLETGNGLRLEPGFLFNFQFWSRPWERADQPVDEVDMEPVGLELASVEKPSHDLRPIICVSDLSKIQERGCCSDGPAAVQVLKNITVTIYESNITAIIGHNGSGKSTLINILSGAQQPTSGQVCVDGVSLSSSLAVMQLRGHFGICSQRNTLSDSLTVKQTVNLALVSSGSYPDESEEELSEILSLLRLTDKLTNVVGTLSGGQKRKLCIALALLGNPKVAIMDEPTSGVDPVSRRRIWKLLQEYKLGRAIVLTTQFMDEADTLADRKIVLTAGSLICAGSSLFLRSVFDCGFIFEVTMKSMDLIPNFLKRIGDEFPTVKLKKRFVTNLELQVPSTNLEVLPALAAYLEKRADIISAYGLAQPTLGDIFMRLKDMSPESVAKLFETKTVGLLTSDAAHAENLSVMDLTPKDKLDALESRTLNPTASKRVVAMLRMNLRRIFRMKFKFCLRLIVPALLLIWLACAAVVERMTRDPNLQNRRTMHHDALQFRHGVCVYDLPNSKDNTTPTQENCDRLLNAQAAPTAGANFLVMHKEQVSSITSFLEKQEVSEILKEICSRGDGNNIGASLCPVFHTDIWNTGIQNVQREANIGMYSPTSTSNISIVAATVMSVYTRSMLYFGGSEARRTKVNVEVVDDFLAVFLPLFGVFVQVIILSVVPATYLDDPVEDKETKVRCQLATMGVSAPNYWITIFIVHWMQYAIVYIISILLLISILPYNHLNAFYLVVICLPTLIFGLTNNLLCAYIVSTFLNKSKHMARVVYIFYSLVIGASLVAAKLNSIVGLLLIYFVPQFAAVALTFYGTTMYFFTNAYYRIDGVQSQPKSMAVYMSHLHVYHSIIAMVFHTGLLIGLLCLADNRRLLLHRFDHLCQPVDDAIYPQGDDPGVLEEIDCIQRERRSSKHLLELRRIRKIYPNGVKAVRDINLGVAPGEILGLLGPNGAGKTSTLAIVVGDEATSCGECEIRFKDKWLKSRNAASLGAIGYCPQHDPLFPGITITEHLLFYAKVLGIHEGLVQRDINILLEGLGLQDHADLPVWGLPEGVRRRACLAVALLGNPTIVVIDEASTGVDPEGKRFIWSVIRSIANSTRALVVTTHSMEEAEALCTRVGIMNHGLMVGLGSIAQLVNMYGEWYTLDIQIRAELNEQPTVVRSRKERATKAVQKYFQSSKILEQFTARITFSIPSESIARLSTALAWLVSNKESLQIAHFSFYQLSLDQVFDFLLKSHDDQIQKQRRMSVFSINTQLSEFDIAMT